ncbi:DUF4035 domain-containing protein [Lonepinella sp. MS14436]|uniref:phage tail assembly protein T n=1 Tax=Lonepinella sp. MS14436 TaxID=3003619 RepID=UPI0036D8C403
MGKTLSEIEQLSERELGEYELFYQQQPFGLWREDYRTAQIAHILALINRDPKQETPTIHEFMPYFNQAKNSEQEEDDGSLALLKQRTKNNS